MPSALRKVLPPSLGNALGKLVSSGVTLHRDAVSIRHTLKNATPAVLSKGLSFRFRRPSVCAVFAGRNDDFVPDNEARIRAVIEWNSKVLCTEVIFVEWNPLPDRPLFSPALTKDYPQLRAYVVPPTIHKQITTNARMPVMEYFAKNVGIRRAQSDFICATNSDILWDENVRRMRWIMGEELVFVTRRKELQWDGSFPTQNYLRDPQNLIEYRFGWRQDLAYGSGDFTLAHKKLWHRARGYDESLTDQRISCDGRGLFQLLELGGKQVHMGFHYHLFHETTSSAAGNASHGEFFDYRQNLPYQNSANWGLGDCREEQLAERVWQLVR
ncbi:MAG: hypothetical protein QOD75_1803 [Blastocatellia bacterium]|jgi:hypothetical protein|nr:hypothetical protein [Blastocatellia bacterium]